MILVAPLRNIMRTFWRTQGVATVGTPPILQRFAGFETFMDSWRPSETSCSVAFNPEDFHARRDFETAARRNGDGNNGFSREMARFCANRANRNPISKTPGFADRSTQRLPIKVLVRPLITANGPLEGGGLTGRSPWKADSQLDRIFYSLTIRSA